MNFIKSRILVACYAGISRSVTITAAYFVMMSRENPDVVLQFMTLVSKFPNNKI